MKFHPDVLAAHAQFGGDLESMQKLYDFPDLRMTSPKSKEQVVPEDIREAAKAAVQENFETGHKWSVTIERAILAERTKSSDAIAALRVCGQFLDHLKRSMEVCGHTQAMMDQVKAALAIYPTPPKGGEE